MNNNCTDVLIHLDKSISYDDIHGLENEISGMEGVYSASTNANARHLMLVKYNPDDVKALDLLHTVTDHGLQAELVGM